EQSYLKFCIRVKLVSLQLWQFSFSDCCFWCFLGFVCLCISLGFFLGRSPLRVPGHKPTDWEKRFLLWAGHFKKPEDIPETVSIETIRAAKTTLRVKISYVMIALTILGCIVMVIKGKQVSTDFWYFCKEARSAFCILKPS
uniref:Family with sequence similarity 162 member A n=1 Tax=Accipiter nisus TaxID=211598 RepID=A0A8B9RVB0_9AVES